MVTLEKTDASQARETEISEVGAISEETETSEVGAISEETETSGVIDLSKKALCGTD